MGNGRLALIFLDISIYFPNWVHNIIATKICKKV